MDGRIRAAPRIAAHGWFRFDGDVSLGGAPRGAVPMRACSSRSNRSRICPARRLCFQDLDDPAAAAPSVKSCAPLTKTFSAAGLITQRAGRPGPGVGVIVPCFTSGTISAHGYCHIPQINVPVSVGGVPIHPGDLLHGDCNGVTTVPLEIAAETADACAEFVTAEAVILDYLRGGKPTPAGFKTAQQECKSMIENLAKRLRR